MFCTWPDSYLRAEIQINIFQPIRNINLNIMIFIALVLGWQMTILTNRSPATEPKTSTGRRHGRVHLVSCMGNMHTVLQYRVTEISSVCLSRDAYPDTYSTRLPQPPALTPLSFGLGVLLFCRVMEMSNRVPPENSLSSPNVFGSENVGRRGSQGYKRYASSTLLLQ